MAAALEPINYSAEDVQKFNRIYHNYNRQLYWKAKSLLKDSDWAEDAVQLTFEKILRHLNQLEDAENGRTRCYLYTVLVNCCYTMMAKNNRYYLMDTETMNTTYASKLSAPDSAVSHVMYEDMMQSVRGIPEIYSNIMILHCVYRYQLSEISSILELKPATVRKRYERARKMLAHVTME